IIEYYFSKKPEEPAVRDGLLWARQLAAHPASYGPTHPTVIGMTLQELLNEDHAPDDDPRPVFRFADIVLGNDKQTKEIWLFFGRDALAALTAGQQTKPIFVVLVGIAADTDDLEKLCALCEVIKGRNEYDGTAVSLGDMGESAT